jgi:hypothetical protein
MSPARQAGCTYGYEYAGSRFNELRITPDLAARKRIEVSDN